MSLKPQNIIQAAEADLARRLNNQHDGGRPRGERYEHYAFHRDHVKRSDQVIRLLVTALMSPPYVYDEEQGIAVLATTKKNTKLIYSNSALLLAAIRMLSDV